MILEKFTLTVLAATALVAAGSTAFAQSAADYADLSKRVGTIETKLDALIEMMAKNKSPVVDAKAPDATAAEAKPDATTDVADASYRPGLILDLYTLDPGDDMSKPNGDPAASAFVKPTSVFDWGAFMAEEGMARYATGMSRQIGLLWSGAIRIGATGSHVFQLESKNDHGSGTANCTSILVIDGKKVVETKPIWNGVYSSVDRGSLALASGLHAFSLSETCVYDRIDPDFSKIHISLLVKTPSDRAPKPVDPSVFVAKE